jgi:hypothetical protein
MTIPALRIVKAFALMAFAFLCINITVKLPRDMVLMVNVQHNYPESRHVAVTYRDPDGSWVYDVPGYSYTEPRDVHKENVFGEYIYQPPVLAEDDEFVGPPEFGTPKSVKNPDKEPE